MILAFTRNLDVFKINSKQKSIGLLGLGTCGCSLVKLGGRRPLRSEASWKSRAGSPDAHRCHRCHRCPCEDAVTCHESLWITLVPVISSERFREQVFTHFQILVLSFRSFGSFWILRIKLSFFTRQIQGWRDPASHQWQWPSTCGQPSFAALFWLRFLQHLPK